MNLSELALDAWAAFESVGGTTEIYEVGFFQTDAQSFFAGLVWAYNKVLFQMGMPTHTNTDYEALERAWKDYE